MARGRAFTLIGRACLRQLMANQTRRKNVTPSAASDAHFAPPAARRYFAIFRGRVRLRIDAIKAELKWLGGNWPRRATWIDS